MIYSNERGEDIAIVAHSCPLCGSDNTRIYKDQPNLWRGDGWDEEKIWTIDCMNCWMVHLALPANNFMGIEKYYETVREAVMEWNAVCQKYSKPEGGK